MINHARTLLLNRSSMYFDGLIDNYYIPTEFSPAALRPPMLSIHDAILPATNSKQEELNIGNIVTHLLHSPDLLPYVLELDSRITYDDAPVNPADFMSGRVSITTAQSSACDIIPAYKFTTSNPIKPQAGRYTWSISSVNSTTVSFKNTRGMSEHVVLNVSSSSTTSKSLDIIPGYLSVYFVLPSLTFTGTFKIDYVLTVSSSYNLPAAMDRLKIAFARGINTLNNSEHNTTLTTLKDIWLHNQSMPTQFGAGVLAYIYTLESMRL